MNFTPDLFWNPSVQGTPLRADAVGAEAALVASIVHERPERLPELKAELEEAGWPMRR